MKEGLKVRGRWIEAKPSQTMSSPVPESSNSMSTTQGCLGGSNEL